MSRQRIIIVGGVAAGPAAAAEAARTDPAAEVVLYERGRAVSYSACELPYLVAGELQDAERLVRYTPERLSETRRIDVRTMHEVQEADVRAGRIVVRDLAAGTVTRERFDKLILATGARAGRAGLEDADGEGCYVIRTLDDAARLRDRIDRTPPDHAVIVGGGFIGLETGTLVAGRGWRVTVLDGNGPLGRHLEPSMVSRVDESLARAGVAVRRERAVSIRRPGMGPRIMVATDRKELVGARLVILAAGITPETGLGGPALKRCPSGTYLVDAEMRTTARNVWACGDCVSVPSLPDARHRWIPLSLVAFRGARTAGHNAARQGREAARVLPPPPGSFTARVADLEVACTGLTVAQAR